MLHASILAGHARWADFLLRLSLVVVDEAHVARGVFGSHVAMVLRRLRRLIAHYGGAPRFCLASATIGNPSELAERLTGLEFEAVDRRRLAPRRAPVRPVEPADHRRGARPAAQRDRRGVLPARAAGRPRDPHDRLRPDAARGAEVIADITRKALPAATKRAGQGVPGRLPARGTARARAGAVEGGAARGRRDQRAGARHRRGGAGRGAARRLPGHAGVDVAAGRPRGAARARARWPS